MNKKNSPQRKTTLKWNSNGELSEIDMLRILEKISTTGLNKCDSTNLTISPKEILLAFLSNITYVTKKNGLLTFKKKIRLNLIF